jgi:hypothetical protein
MGGDDIGIVGHGIVGDVGGIGGGIGGIVGDVGGIGSIVGRIGGVVEGATLPDVGLNVLSIEFVKCEMLWVWHEMLPVGVTSVLCVEMD